MRWRFKDFRLYILLFFLLVGVGFTYFYFTRGEPPIVKMEGSSLAEMEVIAELEIESEIKSKRRDEESLEGFEESLRPKRIEINVAIPAIYIIIFILPLAFVIYLFASVIQVIFSSSLEIRGNSNVDRAKARAVRTRRQQEASEFFED